MSTARSKLTANQKRFVAEYVIDRNAVQAYFRAFGRDTRGDKRRSYMAAAKSAERLVKHPQIAAEIRAAEREHRRRCRVDAERINRELAAVAFADPDDLYEPDPHNHGLPTPRPWRDVPPAARKAVASVKVKRRRRKSADDEVWEIEELEYRCHPKLDALDKLCRRLGLYQDLPPLEAILAALPLGLADAVRAALAAALSGAADANRLPAGDGSAPGVPGGPRPADA